MRVTRGVTSLLNGGTSSAISVQFSRYSGLRRTGANNARFRHRRRFQIKELQ
jgi:hypothetical protein